MLSFAMPDVIQESPGGGEIVRLGELGSLRVYISSEGSETADEVSASSIKNARVIFTPGKGIRDMLQNLEFVKVA